MRSLRPQPGSPRSEGRALLIRQLAAELSRDRAPQLQLMVIMLFAGGAAFLASVLLLWSPADVFERMAPRYAVAALCGYAAFLVLIRVWIALQRPTRQDPIDDALDVLGQADVDLPLPGPGRPTAFDGGRSGGAGGAGEWRLSGPRSGAGSNRSWDVGLDLEDGVVWIVVAAAWAACGVAAIAYVVYTAPVLLAEVALDAAIISALYRRLRADQRGYWLSAVFRRTWVPALILLVFAFAAGFALQQAAPQARSIGGVIQTYATAR